MAFKIIQAQVHDKLYGRIEASRLKRKPPIGSAKWSYSDEIRALIIDSLDRQDGIEKGKAK
jgi:hypothetical protein